MKIIITAASPSLDAEFDPRFGRGAYFLIIDTETLDWEAFPNVGVNASGGAGTQAAQFVAEKMCEAVISGDFGPNASEALNAVGISMYVNKNTGTIRSVIERCKAGELPQVSTPSASGSHHSARS